MPACKHGAWDYCGQCLAEYELEQPVRVTQSPVEIVRKSIPEQDEVARLTGERNEARALLREIEWSGECGDCLLCGHYPPGTRGVDASGLGHAPDCRFKAVLGGRGE